MAITRHYPVVRLAESRRRIGGRSRHYRKGYLVDLERFAMRALIFGASLRGLAIITAVCGTLLLVGEAGYQAGHKDAHEEYQQVQKPQSHYAAALMRVVQHLETKHAEAAE